MSEMEIRCSDIFVERKDKKLDIVHNHQTSKIQCAHNHHLEKNMKGQFKIKHVQKFDHYLMASSTCGNTFGKPLDPRVIAKHMEEKGGNYPEQHDDYFQLATEMHKGLTGCWSLRTRAK